MRVIVPHEPDKSLLIQAVRRTHARIKMPPAGPLPESAVKTLTDWVRSGAPFPDSPVTKAPAATADYWAFRPLDKPNGTLNDHWREALNKKKLTPVSKASRETLLRRVTLDLTGLPPTPVEVDAFAADKSANAFEKVVDRLLSSPHYGVRYARHWLDLARYSDGALAAATDTPFPNAWRYRDWVVEAFNQDMPYPTFVRAQIAADLLPNNSSLLPGLGFQALAAGAHDQVDTTTKVFLGLTAGCAQCHDHKYDPIPTRDYYGLFGIFTSSKVGEYPLAPEAEVKRYKEQKAKVDAQKELITEYLDTQTKLVADILARNTSRYMMAAWKNGETEPGLDAETLKRWKKYLADQNKEHPYMKPWFDVVNKPNVTEAEVKAASDKFQKFTLELIDEAKEVEDKNYVAFGGKKGQKDERTRQYTNIVSLPVLKFYQWRELVLPPYRTDGHSTPAGVYYYGPKDVERFLSGMHKAHLDQLRAELAALEKELPPIYPFLHSVSEAEKPADVKIHIRGDANNLGDVAPRRFLSCLSDTDGGKVSSGSGRWLVAESVAGHPLTARVIANRIWQWHFGTPLVRTPSNFGRNGDPPADPALLDYLAAQLTHTYKGSLKALHREILLSDAYALSALSNGENANIDPENRHFWRYPAGTRLDFETLRDSVLYLSGDLETKLAGPADGLSAKHQRRSLYLTVSRTRLDPTMALFDFPDPNATSESRTITTGPLQGLFFLNSDFLLKGSDRVAARIKREAPENPVPLAYKLVLNREPSAKEAELGKAAVSNPEALPQYVQVLMSTAEFLTAP